jgi:hypothetical protein
MHILTLKIKLDNKMFTDWNNSRFSIIDAISDALEIPDTDIEVV